MTRKRIAIACQGGGSQCAFVAGVLERIFARGVDERYEIVGLSGTSGGAITAALAWSGMLEKAQGLRTLPVGDQILSLWKDLSAQSPSEIVMDKVVIGMLRMAEHGLMPSMAMSPSSLQFQFWARAASAMIARPEFTDLRALLLKHIDFAKLPQLVRPDSPVLLVGAGDVLQGNFKVFSSDRDEIKVESILASAAIPNLFPAVWVDGHAYWDGIFASNPPIVAFMQKAWMGSHPRPDEIWIIQVNPAQHETVPELPSDITDRRNHLAGNLSLQHELQIIEMWNVLIQEGALTDHFRRRFGVDVLEPVAVHFIRMSEGLQEGLDYPSKLSRQPGHIERLIADGQTQADLFLDRNGHPPAPRAGAPRPLVEGIAQHGPLGPP